MFLGSCLELQQTLSWHAGAPGPADVARETEDEATAVGATGQQHTGSSREEHRGGKRKQMSEPVGTIPGKETNAAARKRRLQQKRAEIRQAGCHTGMQNLLHMSEAAKEDVRATLQPLLSDPDEYGCITAKPDAKGIWHSNGRARVRLDTYKPDGAPLPRSRQAQLLYHATVAVATGEDWKLRIMAAPGSNVSPVRACRVYCYNNQVSDNAVVTAVWISAGVGLFFILVFATFRSKIRIYETRLFLPQTWIKPPAIPSGHFSNYWSWLLPVLTTSDADLLLTAGLDSLMLSWTNTLGIQIFLPLTILGCGFLLPINLSGNRVQETRASIATNDSTNSNASNFMKLTLSNLARADAKYWCAFVFVWMACLYIMWLLALYYRAYVRLRQNWLSGAEGLVHDWHKQQVKNDAKERGAVQKFRTLFDPTSMDTILEGSPSAAGSMHEGHVTSALRRLDRTSITSSIRQSNRSYTRSVTFHGADSSATRSSKPPVYKRSQSVAGPRPEPHQMLHHDAADLGQAGRLHSSPATPTSRLADLAMQGRRGSAGTVGQTTHNPLFQQGRPRTSQESQAHTATTSMGDPQDSATLSQLEAQRSGYSDALPPRPGPVAEGVGSDHDSLSGSPTNLLAKNQGGALPREDLEQPSMHSLASSMLSAPGVQAIARYETKPVDAHAAKGHERLSRWWRADGSMAVVDGRSLTGKPPVHFRKVIKTTNQAGETVGVNAQQYAVLVTDVPNPLQERRRRAEQLEKWTAAKSGATTFWGKLRGRGRVQYEQTQVDDRRNTDTLTDPSARAGQLAGAGSATGKDLHQGGSSGQQTGWATPAEAGPTPAGELNGASRGPGAQPQEAAGESATPAEPVTDAGFDGDSRRTSSDDSNSESSPLRRHGGLFDEDSMSQNDGSRGKGERRKSAEGPGYGGVPATPDDIRLDVAEPEKSGLDVGMDPDHDPVDDMDAEQLVTAAFRNLFPNGFDRVQPIRNHKAVDLLLMEWDRACGMLERGEALYEQSGCTKRPRQKLGCCGCIGEEVDIIDYYAAKVRELEAAILEARQKVLASEPTSSFFVFFHTQRDAAIAAQTKLHAEDGHDFRVYEAPGPEEVNWSVLWMNYKEQELRGLIVIPLIVLLMLVPIGLFSGAIAQATVAICGSSGFFNRFYSSAYCGQNSLLRSIITGILPQVLLLLWQNLIMPNALYRLAQIEGQWVSLSALDRRICSLFFYWAVFNVFLGAMLGGSAFSELGIWINNPAGIPASIGVTLPNSSNFFINYIVIQGIAMLPFRIMYPHIGVLVGLFRLMGCCGLPSEREKTAALWPHSVRYGREIGTIMLIFVMALAYAATSPLILPFTLIYFIMSWIFWRYNMLYVSERCFESGGRIFQQVFNQLCWCLFIFVFFTACVLLANSAFTQCFLLVAFLTPLIYKFNKYYNIRFGTSVAHIPLEMATAAPHATVDPMIYTPPALRPGAYGWYPEYGKAWEYWGAPTYTY
ncbi:hypothetical protein WJX72_009273 [[Myrmecia] bisecta]|uniref:Uncharacterized protein n=1 Tax=[Myrmecia] bisecta TaxID=41462 RepID=A0AAW1Q438_9CHLO